MYDVILDQNMLYEEGFSGNNLYTNSYSFYFKILVIIIKLKFKNLFYYKKTFFIL